MEHNKRHSFIWWFFRPLVQLIVWIKFNFRAKAVDVKGPCIVLCNHVTDWDPLLLGAAFRRQMYFVASEHILRLGFVSRLLVWMVVLIYMLNIIQRALYEFNLMDRISRFFSPLLTVFGLPKETSFLWIVANVIGLSYGSAAMLDEMDRGMISRRNIDLLNTHIGISHSNLEDLMLLSAVGGAWYWILLFRWGLVIILVWSVRLYYKITEHGKEKREL